MKKIALLALAVSFYFFAAAQHRDALLEDSILYWITWVPEKPWKPLSADGRTLTVAQKTEMYRIADWMMQSYHPVGGVGSFKSILNVRTSSDFTDYRLHNYYLDFRVWNVSYDNMDAEGHFKAIPEEYHKFPVGFNQIPGDPIEFLNGPAVCYFTWRAAVGESKVATNNPYGNADPKISANCAPFIVRNESVILSPNNQLPFQRVSIGEWLEACEKALPYAMDVAKAHKDPKYQDGLEAEYKRYRDWIRKWKAVYAGKLDRPASLVNGQVTLGGTFDQDVDPFNSNTGLESYEVWKVKPETFEKARQDKPLFITFSIPTKTSEDGIQQYELYQALTQNVNYQYIYDYYFNPAKVQNKVYKPADEQGMLKRLAHYKGKLPDGTQAGPETGAARSAVSKKPDAGVLLNDNFSNAAIGQMPAGWYNRTVGKTSSVENIPGVDGHWLKLGINNTTFPTTLPKKLSQHFILDLDVVSVADFQGRTGGQLLIHISNGSGYSRNGDEMLKPDGFSLDLKLIAGNDADRAASSNFRGAIELEIHESGGASKENNKEGLYLTKPLPEFTSKHTGVHVTLDINAGMCTVFVNKKNVINPIEMKLSYGSNCKQCGLAADKEFSLLSFKNIDDTGENLPVYIGNVKLVKK